MNTNYVFKRVEKKYLIPCFKFNLLIKRIAPYVEMDKYGINTICNIYYDTSTYELIRNSIEGPNYKEKLRLRSYGTPSKYDMVFLELKKKYDGTVYKRRISLTLEEAENYLEHGIKPLVKSQILGEIDYFINLYKPEKKVFIAYDRVAFYGKDDEHLRITFDMNIRSRFHDLDLAKGSNGKNIDNCEGYLMEIKTSNAMPLWLVNTLSEYEVYPNSFSKYGNIYRQSLVNELSETKQTQTITINRRDEKCLQAS